MKNVLIALCLLALNTTPLPVMADEPEAPAEYLADGLKLVPDTKGISRVWLRPGVDLSQYRSVYLVEPSVAFRKNWLKDQNRGHPSIRVKEGDMEDIKRDIKKLFMEVFTEELLGAGFDFAELRAPGVMIIKSAILDLDVNAPDIQSSGTSDILVSTAGSMKLYLEIYDSMTEQLLVKAVDQASDWDTGQMQSQKKVANRAAAKRMMTPWAKALSRGFSAPAEATPN